MFCCCVLLHLHHFVHHGILSFIYYSLDFRCLVIRETSYHDHFHIVKPAQTLLHGFEIRLADVIYGLGIHVCPLLVVFGIPGVVHAE